METKSFSEMYSGKSGVYIITPSWLFDEKFTDDQSFLVKIGESTYNTETKRGTKLSLTGLAYRLDHYLAYFVDGFYIWAVFTTRPEDSKSLEASIHAYLKGKKRDFDFINNKTHSRSSEWFYLSKNDLSELIRLFTIDSDMKHVILEPYTRTTFLEINQKVSTRAVPPMSTPQRRRIDQDNNVNLLTTERPDPVVRRLF